MPFAVNQNFLKPVYSSGVEEEEEKSEGVRVSIPLLFLKILVKFFLKFVERKTTHWKK